MAKESTAYFILHPVTTKLYLNTSKCLKTVQGIFSML